MCKKSFILILAVFCLGIGTGKAQYTVIHTFNDTTGGEPYGNLTPYGSKLFGMTSYGGAENAGVIFSIDTNGKNYRVLWNFYDTTTNGAEPMGSLTISGNVMYGMTSAGGVYDNGCVFSIDTNGSGFKDLLDFNGTNGASPSGSGSITLSGSKLFVMTGSSGGANGLGNIFSLNTNGTGYKDLHDFIDSTGGNSSGSLALSGGVLYGMNDDGPTGNGVIFSIDTNGTGYNDLFVFSGDGSTAADPFGSLTISGNVLYGMTYGGGTVAEGAVFSINMNGTGYKTLVNFEGSDFPQGANPWGNLTLSGNVLYGMATLGGANAEGDIFSVNTNGTGFTDLHDFIDSTGNGSQGSLIISGNSLYGMSINGGTDNAGVIFKFKQTSLGIEELNVSAGGINLCPNPASDKIEVSSKQSAVSSIEIYNLLGERIYSLLITDNRSPITINIADLPSGVYLLKAITENGAVIKRFIKE
jgi:uncharacterized repeat protein (TIGR03803 family)